MNYLKSSLMLALMAGLLFFSNCGSDDTEDPGPGPTTPSSAVLDFILDGTSYVLDFDGIAASILGVTSPQVSWTNITMAGVTSSGETVTMAFVFDGKSAGTYAFEGRPAEDPSDPTGLSLVIASGITGVEYTAVNITLEVDSYNLLSEVAAEAAGTFGGTVVDEDTGNTFFISGTFNTGDFD